MNKRLLTKTKRYYKIYNVVSPNIYIKYGVHAWKFFDPRLLSVLVWLREGLKKTPYINDWFYGGPFDERGLISNVDETPRDKTVSREIYMSPHILGKGVLFDVKNVSPDLVREWIEKNQRGCPCDIRVQYTSNDIPLRSVYVDVVSGFGDKLTKLYE